jgi:hypothetical protein
VTVLLLQHERHRRTLPGLLLHLVIELDSLLGVEFGGRLPDLIGQLIGVEGLGIRVRVAIPLPITSLRQREPSILK